MSQGSVTCLDFTIVLDIWTQIPVQLETLSQISTQKEFSFNRNKRIFKNTINWFVLTWIFGENFPNDIAFIFNSMKNYSWVDSGMLLKMFPKNPGKWRTVLLVYYIYRTLLSKTLKCVGVCTNADAFAFSIFGQFYCR